MNNKLGTALLISAFFVIVCTTLVEIKNIESEEAEEIVAEEQEIIEPTPTPIPTITPNKTVLYYQSYIKGANLDRVKVSAVCMRLEYIGVHYITAYCPEECGYRAYSDGTDNFPSGWITATGTIAHREEEWYKPSTCGIATDYHRYGELFYIEGKVYVAEDTGYISGAWIDLFMPDYETMMSFGSHWTEVYSVEYVTTEAKAGKHFNINDYIGGELNNENPKTITDRQDKCYQERTKRLQKRNATLQRRQQTLAKRAKTTYYV